MVRMVLIGTPSRTSATRPDHRCDDGPGDGEVLKSLWVVCEPCYCGILHSVPSGKAVAAGMVETMLNQPWGSASCAELLTLAT
jgi:hypothetical protein